MENASKALIMAGSVLIALMIIGALLLMFNSISSYQQTDTESARQAQVVQFNNGYSTYNRKNVRGSDLYSLLNKAIDYNRRESSAGTGWSDQGQSLQYEPMTIKFSITPADFRIDSTNRLFTGSGNYEISGNTNTFENSIKAKIDNLENEYGQESLVSLSSNITRIFPDTEEVDTVEQFNKISKRVTVSSWDEIKPGSQIRNDVYTYYEYIQFKRAYFDCESVEYNQETGRIVEMVFKFTGKFN